MSNDTNNEPNNRGVEYSGSAYGDARDPQSLEQIIPALQQEIVRRQAHPELFEARSALKRLSDAQLRGETVDDDVLKAAQDAVMRAEADIRGSEPTSE